MGKCRSLPEHVEVPLNLEESGTLCHLLMGKLLDAKVDLNRPVAQHEAIIQRMLALYMKLSNANDTLMGK